jgi:DNA-directed RNA polymerase subunit RPC12/RpoP
MAETITITCPDCEKQLKGPAELAGRRVRCKFCSHVFLVAAKAAARGDGKANPAKGQPAAEAKPVKAKVAPAAPAKTKPAPAPRPAKAPPAPPPMDEVLPAEDAVLPLAIQEESEGKNPYQLSDVVLTPRCPQCAAEFESEDQVICLDCGYNTQTRQRTTLVKTVETTAFERILWLLPGIVCVLVSLALVSLVVYMWIIWWDADDWWAKPMKIWGGFILVFISWILTRFAFKRLILHPSPPEKIKR